LKKKTIVFDLDGTLSCGKHRLNLLPKKADAHLTHSWDEFNLAAGKDKPIQDNINLLRLLPANYDIIILTGRCDVAKDITLKWLKDYHVAYDTLIMRKQDDHRVDTEFKEEELRKIGLDNILCCFDDLEHVAKHIRSIGVTCHLVTHYDIDRVDVTKREDK
jgi:phosphoglycolate phosphatase-like HAD superfamily hydrolase